MGSDQTTTDDTSRSGGQGRRFLWSLLNEVIGLGTAAVLFLTLTLFFDPAVYGQLGAVLAVATIATPLANLGSSWLLLRRVVVSEDLRDDLGRAVSTAAVGTSLATIALVFVAPVILPGIERTTILTILLGQLVFLSLSEFPIGFFVALGDLRMAARTRILSSFFRLLGLALFALYGSHDLATWGTFLAVSTAVACLVAFGQVARHSVGWPQLARPTVDEARTGLPYALGNTSEGFLAASDRPILVAYGFEAGAGFYAAGYRLATLGFVPLMALLRANDRRVFGAGSIGVGAALGDVRRLSIQALMLSAVVSATLFLAAPIVIENLLPPSYGETARVVQFLAFLPMVKALQFPAGNLLTATGLQNRRVLATIATTILNLVLNFVLIPGRGWEMAVVTTFVAEITLGVLFWIVALRALRVERTMSSNRPIE